MPAGSMKVMAVRSTIEASVALVVDHVDQPIPQLRPVGADAAVNVHDDLAE